MEKTNEQPTAASTGGDKRLDGRMNSLTDKVVVITGAGSGIGLATAEAFLSAGAKVYLVDKDPRIYEVAEALGPSAEGRQLDVTNASALKDLAEEVIATEGRVDVLHNNAGVCLSKPVDALSIEDWQWVMDINLWGVIHGVQAFVPHMIRRRSGHIINTASLAGLMPFPLVVPYCASKYAVVGLSEALAAELAPKNISVTVECPGMVATKLFESARVGWSDEARGRFENIMATRGTDPQRIARNIVKAVRSKQVVHVSAGPALPLFWLRRLSWAAYAKLAGWVAGLKKDGVVVCSQEREGDGAPAEGVGRR